jgi:hypothetical protein
LDANNAEYSLDLELFIFLTILSLSSGHPSRLWVGEADDDQNIVSLGVLHQGIVVCQ